MLEGKVPDGSDIRLGRRGKDGEILYRLPVAGPERKRRLTATRI